MVSKKVAALAALAAVADAADVQHRHLHDKRAIETVTDYVTKWETVYVTPGQEAPVPEPTEEATIPDEGNNPPPPPAAAPTTVVVDDTPAQNNPVNNEPEAPAPEAPAAESPAPESPEVESPDVPTPPKTTKVAEPEPEPTSAAPEPPKTSSASPPPSSPPTGGNPVSGKRGISYNSASLADTFSSACESCAWAYNWGSASDGLSADVAYIPTLWGPNGDFPTWFETNGPKAVAAGAPAIFSFNEPDFPTQANCPAPEAAVQHAKYLGEYKGKVPVGAPSVTNSGEGGKGLEWLSLFVESCANTEGCHYDFCNLHWYSEVEYANTLFEHLEKGHEICGGKPIWLTEFRPAGSEEAINDFIREVVPELDALEYLHGYAYFMVSDGELMAGESLSSAGQAYASA
jgi:hypothetical protein